MVNLNTAQGVTIAPERIKESDFENETSRAADSAPQATLDRDRDDRLGAVFLGWSPPP